MEVKLFLLTLYNWLLIRVKSPVFIKPLICTKHQQKRWVGYESFIQEFYTSNYFKKWKKANMEHFHLINLVKYNLQMYRKVQKLESSVKFHKVNTVM